MLGRYQAVFRSRWRAVFWSLGVLLTAYCTIPSSKNGHDPLAGAEEAALAAIVEQGQQRPAEHRHVNPWALQEGEGRH